MVSLTHIKIGAFCFGKAWRLTRASLPEAPFKDLCIQRILICIKCIVHLSILSNLVRLVLIRKLHYGPTNLEYFEKYILSGIFISFKIMSIPYTKYKYFIQHLH